MFTGARPHEMFHRSYQLLQVNTDIQVCRFRSSKSSLHLNVVDKVTAQNTEKTEVQARWAVPPPGKELDTGCPHTSTWKGQVAVLGPGEGSEGLEVDSRFLLGMAFHLPQP